MTARKGHGAGGRGRLAKAAITAAVALFSIAGASSASADEAMIEGCLKAAAEVHHVPAGVLALLIRVEAGRLGAVSQNANGTVDIGPMQVNDTWLGKIADHWRTSREAAYRALRDNFCANVESGAWILHQALDEARGLLMGGRRALPFSYPRPTARIHEARLRSGDAAEARGDARARERRH